MPAAQTVLARQPFLDADESDDPKTSSAASRLQQVFKDLAAPRGLSERRIIGLIRLKRPVGCGTRLGHIPLRPESVDLRTINAVPC
ncbi:MAG TPA: hypothetical protein DD723_10665 [Candidatus Omnitrophica bacterium]|nr:MAG: hypothetical protein A2Z81_09685 [Omnitrophica WOR_2 bacterium GWA2_45_18]HBR15979.1 hypothetical protein [Candidatus Omnitrophota bacterium]